MAEYEMRADIAKNRLYITLEGFFTDREIKKAADRMIEETQKLKPGFDVINDISSFKPATPQGAEEIKRAQLFLKEANVRRVIRVVRKQTLNEYQPLGVQQMERKSREVGYEADVFSSIEQAEEALDKGK